MTPKYPVTAAIPAAVRSQKLCKLLPDFDIYGYMELELGSPKKLLVALFDLAIAVHSRQKPAPITQTGRRKFLDGAGWVAILWSNMRLRLASHLSNEFRARPHNFLTTCI